MQTEEMQNIKPTGKAALILATISHDEATKTIWLLASLCSAVSNGILKPEEIPKDPNDVLLLTIKHGVMGK